MAQAVAGHNISTNIGKEFLNLLDRAFQPDNPQSFNRQTVKFRYKRMPNMVQKVAGHNARVLREDRQAVQQPQGRER